MSYLIFILDKENRDIVDEILKHDLISRQSITVKNAKALGINKEQNFILIEGSEENLKKTKEIFVDGKIKEEEKGEEIYNKIKKEESEAADGFGAVFG